MQSEILYRSAYSLLKVELEPGDELRAEAGACSEATRLARAVASANEGVKLWA